MQNLSQSVRRYTPILLFFSGIFYISYHICEIACAAYTICVSMYVCGEYIETYVC